MALIGTAAGNITLTMGAAGQLKSLQKTVQEEKPVVQPPEEHEESAPSHKKGLDNEPAAAQQQTRQQQHRGISLNYGQYKSDQTQQKTGTEESQETQRWTPQGGNEAGQGPRVYSFDTSGLIRLRYEQSKASQDSSPSTPNPAAQKERFLRQLHERVKIEYNQFVKSDDNTYTRKNLRDIMSAILQDRNFSSKDQSRVVDRDGWLYQEDDGRPGELAGYNKFNQMRLMRTMGAMQQYQQEPPQDQLSLVA